MYIIGFLSLSKGLLEKIRSSQPSRGFRALDAKGIQRNVGDRYVVEEMRRSGYNLGGEQSGHVVIMDYLRLVMVN